MNMNNQKSPFLRLICKLLPISYSTAKYICQFSTPGMWTANIAPPMTISDSSWPTSGVSLIIYVRQGCGIFWLNPYRDTLQVWQPMQERQSNRLQFQYIDQYKTKLSEPKGDEKEYWSGDGGWRGDVTTRYPGIPAGLPRALTCPAAGPPPI